MYRLKSRSIDALVTPGHKFLLDTGNVVEVGDLRNHHRILVMADSMADTQDPAVSDAMVEVVGWAVTEGHYKRNGSGNVTTIEIAQKDGRPECDRIRTALTEAGARWHEFLAGQGKALTAAEVREVRFHDLRHTFGTQMAAAGCPLRTLQGYMGHASYVTTEVYADFAPDPTKGAAWAEEAFGEVATEEALPVDEVTADRAGPRTFR